MSSNPTEAGRSRAPRMNASAIAPTPAVRCFARRQSLLSTPPEASP